MDIITRAHLIAATAHAGTFRSTGDPYISHPAAVAAALARDGYGADHQAVGWLHDTVEDTDITLTDLRTAGFSEPIIRAIDALTRRPGENKIAAAHRAAANHIARPVKLRDNLHNSSAHELRCYDETTRLRKQAAYRATRHILTSPAFATQPSPTAHVLTAPADTTNRRLHQPTRRGPCHLPGHHRLGLRTPATSQ